MFKPFFGSLLLLLGVLRLPAQDEMKLRIHWEPGTTYVLETTTDTTARKPDGSGVGGLMQVVQTSEMVATLDATKQTRLDVLIAVVRGKIEKEGKSETFDSTRKGEQSEVLQSLGAAVGKKFTLVYDDNGRFRDVSGLAAAPGSQLTLSGMAEARDVAILFRKSLEMGLPAVPVRIGDTWTADETMTFPQAGEVRVQMNGRLVGIEARDGRRHAKVAFRGTFGNTAPRAGKPVAMMEITNDSTMDGELVFDLERHFVSTASYTSSIKLIVPGQTIAFGQKVTSVMTVAK